MTLILDDRGVVSLQGADAKSLLQGLVTNDVRMVTPGALRYAALLTPQGKILFDFLMVERDGELLLDCVKSLRDQLAKRLSLYRLRAQVEIRPRDDLAVAWTADTANTPADLLRDPRHPDLGARGIVPAAGTSAAAARYLAARLEAGVPEGLDFGQDKMFALDADLEELGGVAFDKGCYVGQELTARMKHRGSARKRLLPVSSPGGTPFGADTAVTAEGREIGTVQSSYGTRGFALIRMDRWQDVKSTPTYVDDNPVRIEKPEWLFS